MRIAKYKLLDHTADFGIEVTGDDQRTLFANAALAMFDVITNTNALIGEGELQLHVVGSDRCDLMVNWLRELLYVWNGKKLLIKEVEIFSFFEKKLSASVTYDEFDPEIHEIKNEIKAVTYHQIAVEQVEERWNAKIIFDV